MAAGLSACAPAALLRPGPAWPNHPVRRIAVASIADFPGARDSGPLAESALKRALAGAGYVLVDLWNQADAVVYADLTDFAEASPQDVRLFAPPYDGPAFSDRFSAVGNGGRLVVDVSLVWRSTRPPEHAWVAKWASARVGLRLRLAEAATGQDIALCWAASRPDRFQAALDYTYHQTARAAADQASAALVAALDRTARRPRIVTAAAK